MTCAQGLLRLLWGGPEVGVLRDCSLRCKYQLSDCHEGDLQTEKRSPLIITTENASTEDEEMRSGSFIDASCRSD